MKVSCPRQQLLDAANNVQRAVNSKASIPALEGILLRTEDTSIHLCGYDLELGITTVIPAAITESGSLVVSARLFCDILRRLDSENVELRTDHKNILVITAGNAEFSIMTSPAEEFPELPAVHDTTQINLSRELFCSMVRQTLYAVAQADNKPIHTGSLFEIGDGYIDIVSLDGYRLAKRREAISVQESMRFVVPGKSLSEVLRIAGASDCEDVRILTGSRHIVFSIDSYQIISRLLEGEFLDYHQSIPAGNTTTVRVRVRDFVESIERASLLISDRLKSPVRCIFREESIKVSCATAIGKVRDEITAQIQGEEVEMGFNNKYLFDALRAAECDEVKIELTGAISPMKIVPPEGDSFLFLVLPVRLRNEL